MPISRFIFSYLKNQSIDSQGLLKRLGPSKRFYSSSSKNSSRQTGSRPFVTEETPTSNSRRSYILPAAVLGGLGGVAFLFHYNDEKRAVPKGQGTDADRNIIKGPTVGGPFSLFDTKGQLFTERDLLGNWVLLYFGYTSSPDIGPAEVHKMTKAIHILESKQNIKILPVFVTIDPQRDTPAQLQAYLKEFDPRIVGLTGSVGAIRQLAQEYRVFFKKVEEDDDDYLVESSHRMHLINPKLEVLRCFGTEYNAEEMAEAMLKEMKISET